MASIEVRELNVVRGLIATIFRDTYRSKLNVFAKHERVTLIGTWKGERIAPIFAPTDGAPAIVLGETVPGHVVAWPADKGDRWLMFGGSFVWTGDSRWPTGQPIPLHDRYEGGEYVRAL